MVTGCKGRTLAMAEAVRSTSTPMRMSDGERATMIAAAENFASSGMLNEELLPAMWEPLGLRRDEYGDAVLYLVRLEFASWREIRTLAEPGAFHTGSRTATRPSAKKIWHDAQRYPGTEVLSLTIALGDKSPSGVL